MLFFLQVRRAKRTPVAAVRIAEDLVAEGVVDLPRALAAVTTEHVRQVERPGFDPAEVAGARQRGDLLTTGIGACPGQVSGVLVLDLRAGPGPGRRGQAGRPRPPRDQPHGSQGMIAAHGIVTATGGATSHAAVVARALGTACVVGAAALDIDVDAGTPHGGRPGARRGRRGVARRCQRRDLRGYLHPGGSGRRQREPAQVAGAGSRGRPLPGVRPGDPARPGRSLPAPAASTAWSRRSTTCWRPAGGWTSWSRP